MIILCQCGAQTDRPYDYCGFCLVKIAIAAMADGYTVAGGVVMKPCSCYAEECICHGTGIVAGGGGT